MIFCDLQCVADTTFVGFFRQLKAPAEVRIGRFEVDECRSVVFKIRAIVLHSS
jgi:hypothetical protein